MKTDFRITSFVNVKCLFQILVKKDGKKTKTGNIEKRERALKKASESCPQGKNSLAHDIYLSVKYLSPLNSLGNQQRTYIILPTRLDSSGVYRLLNLRDEIPSSFKKKIARLSSFKNVDIFGKSCYGMASRTGYQF